MKPVQQTITGEGGDCLRACVASLLELPIEEVPNFCEDRDWCVWLPKLQICLQARGLKMEVYTTSWCEEPAMAWGYSPRGLPHSVIYQSGRLAHDPHPSGDGIVCPLYFVKIVEVDQ